MQSHSQCSTTPDMHARRRAGPAALQPFLSDLMLATLLGPHLLVAASSQGARAAHLRAHGPARRARRLVRAVRRRAQRQSTCVVRHFTRARALACCCARGLPHNTIRPLWGREDPPRAMAGHARPCLVLSSKRPARAHSADSLSDPSLPCSTAPWPAVAIERSMWQQPVDAGAISERGRKGAAEERSRQLQAALKDRGCREIFTPNPTLLLEGQVRAALASGGLRQTCMSPATSRAPRMSRVCSHKV
jgi:hypothetical protein